MNQKKNSDTMHDLYDINNIKASKSTMRQALLKRLHGLSEAYLAASNKEIFRHIIDFAAFQQAGTLFCFVGVGREIDTLPVIEAALQAGKRVTVPKCVGKGVMVACEIKALSELSKGKYELLEPAEDYRPVSRSMIDFAIVPCLACDLQGYRLGWGGGYYDRYLAGSFFPKAVICRAQMLEPAIPHAAYDVPIETIITEKGISHKSDIDNG